MVLTHFVVADDFFVCMCVSGVNIKGSKSVTRAKTRGQTALGAHEGTGEKRYAVFPQTPDFEN